MVYIVQLYQYTKPMHLQMLPYCTISFENKIDGEYPPYSSFMLKLGNFTNILSGLTTFSLHYHLSDYSSLAGP